MTTRRTLLRGLGIALGGLALVAVQASPSEASATRRGPADADVELVLLHGTKAAQALIPAGYAELGKPPFNAYNHYDILSTKRLALLTNKTSSEPLPDGSTLDSTLLEKGEKFKIGIVVKDGKGAQVSKGKYTAAKGARFMPVTLPYKGGNLVVSVKVL